MLLKCTTVAAALTMAVRLACDGPTVTCCSFLSPFKSASVQRQTESESKRITCYNCLPLIAIIRLTD